MIDASGFDKRIRNYGYTYGRISIPRHIQADPGSQDEKERKQRKAHRRPFRFPSGIVGAWMSLSSGTERSGSPSCSSMGFAITSLEARYRAITF
jgi:hypothetical protein